ncbi:hypothetical protein DXG01_015454 [Tephrocybe rancida]|nr:hypothetical protein DXG01_015454 [Tephrocybe rancida]
MVPIDSVPSNLPDAAPSSGSVTATRNSAVTTPRRSRVDVIQSEGGSVTATGNPAITTPRSSQSEGILVPDFSPSPLKRSAARNTLIFALKQLCTVHVPGLAAATGTLLFIMDGIQVPGGSQGITGCLVEELHDLAAEIDKFAMANKLEAFFNDDVSAFDAHSDTLENIISDLISSRQFALATATKRDTSQIRKDIEEALKHFQVDESLVDDCLDTKQTANGFENVTPGRMETRMFENEFSG